MINQVEEAPLLIGTWLYDHTIPCEVRIIKCTELYGTGDDEDPPEIANDRIVDCFYIFYQTTIGTPKWVGGGATLSLEEAMSHAKSVLGSSLVWNCLPDQGEK